MVLGLVLIAFLVPMALIDLEHRIIPNKLTGPAAIAAVVIGLALDPGGEPERLIAGAAGGGFFLLAALAAPGGMGMGDVKLAGVLGLFLGAAVAPALLIALITGVLVERRRHRPQGRRRRPQDGDPVRPVPGLRRHRRDARRHGPHGLVPEHLLAPGNPCVGPESRGLPRLSCASGRPIDEHRAGRMIGRGTGSLQNPARRPIF